MRKDLVAAIATLPEPYRQILILRDIDELTASEAVDQLGISIDAVKSRLHRARALVRNNLLAGGDLASASLPGGRSMYCSRSISVHLLRGLSAVVLIALAAIYDGANAWLLQPLLIGAIALMRGCSMCWLMGLVEVAKTRRDTAP